MMNKIESLKNTFPDAHIININRCPGRTIPSTIELNAQIYRFFTSIKMTKNVEQKLFELILVWYKMADSSLEAHFPKRTLKIDFNDLVKTPNVVMKKLSEFFNFNLYEEDLFDDSVRKSHISTNNYSPLSNSELESVLNELPFLKEYCH